MPATYNPSSTSKMQSSNTGGNTYHTATGIPTGETGSSTTSETNSSTAGATSEATRPSTNSDTTSKFQSAKNATREFLHRDKQHNTEVCENFKPAVVKEVVQPVEREELTTAIDRELHKDHYQTRIQPIAESVVATEQHLHNVLPVENREKRHGKEHEIERTLEEEASRFKDTSETLATKYESASSGTVAGEHVHHHVHETVQPVIEREIIQPSIIHTTKPIHELVEHEPTFHPATVQPKMTMQEFTAAGGSLDGKPEVRDFFEGEPQVKENGGAQQRHPTPRVSRTNAVRTEAPGALERQHTPPIRA